MFDIFNPVANPQKQIIFTLYSLSSRYLPGSTTDIKPSGCFEQQLVSSSRPPGRTSVRPVVTSATVCKPFRSQRCHFHCGCTCPWHWSCLFTRPATVTAALALHCTRLTAAVSGWLFLKPRRRRRFMLQQFVVITTDDWVGDHWRGFGRNGHKWSIICLLSTTRRRSGVG